MYAAARQFGLPQQMTPWSPFKEMELALLSPSPYKFPRQKLRFTKL
jgi:hypothetical protein